MIGFGGELAFPVGADGREGEEFIATADKEKPKVVKVGVNTLGGVAGGGAGVDLTCRTGGGATAVIKRLTAGGQSGGQEQKLSAVDDHVGPGVSRAGFQYSNTRLLTMPQWTSARASLLKGKIKPRPS